MKVAKYLLCLAVFVTAPLHAQNLNILLTNDDGYEHPWIRALHASLIVAGHRVTLVAPTQDMSGKAASLTLTDAPVINPEPGIYAVDATPASAVTLGVMRIMEERPDLVVSGINDAMNIGVLSSFSGTVGATVAAQHLVGAPIPAIAISGNPVDLESDPRSEVNVAHARQIADFVARLIANLEQSSEERGGLLPPGIALNINYPGLEPEQIQGVGIYRHGRDLAPIMELMGGSERADTMPGEDQDLGALGEAMRAGMAVGEADRKDWDTEAILQGHITIVPIDGDYTAQQWQTLLSPDVLEGLLDTASGGP